MKKFTYIFLALLTFTVASPVAAETVYRVGQEAEVSKEQVVKNDLYISAGIFDRTSVSGSVEGDVYALGSAVVIDGTVGADIFAIGGSVTAGADTADDVRIVAGDVLINGPVGGDVFVIGGTVTISEDATVEGDVLIFAGDAEINGVVKGSIFGSVDRLRIDSSIGGDVELSVPVQLTLGDKADVSGNVTYESRNDLVRSQNSVVVGEIQKQSPALGEGDGAWRKVITPLFILLFSALSLFLLFKSQLQDMTEDIYAHPLISGGLGISAIFAGPLVAMILILTVLASPLGVALAGLLALLYGIAFALSGIVFGMYMARWLFGIEQLELPVLLAGIVTLYVIYYVPFVGGLIFLTFYCVSIGATIRFLVRKIT